MKQPLAWHAQKIDDVFDALQTSEDGLLTEEVTSRREEYGENALPASEDRGAIEIFFRQFANPLIIILVVAAGASFILREWLDVFVIWAAILLNVILGFVEEYKADQSLQRLQSYLPENVRVRRNGEVLSVASSEVTVGDIVLLSAGDKITADGRLITVANLEVNEAALTGESYPVNKLIEPVEHHVAVADQLSMVFAGTTVVGGTAEFVVTAVGLRTEIGHITKLVGDVEDEKTPLQKQLDNFARLLGAGVLALATAIFFIGVIQGVEIGEMFHIAVALAVAAIPEGLVVAMTVILAVGIQRILKKDALVRRLVASETLGSVSVICMDKTGTLTTGEMAVEKVEGEDISRLTQAIFATNGAIDVLNDEGKRVLQGSPTELALMQWARKQGNDTHCEKLHELPFDSSRKFTATHTRCGAESVLFAVGAPDVLLPRCDISDLEREKQYQRLSELTEMGLRVIMVVQHVGFSTNTDITAQDIRDMKPLGYIGMKDPLRDEAFDAIKRARKAGLRPIMITGDHPKTAFLIAKEAGLVVDEFHVMTGEDLDEMGDVEFAQAVKKVDVYARVAPRHKLRIVRAWQQKGLAVAMTGDGVNDAPAIKAADIGIAFGSGTAVAKETADMVLLKNNFSTIIAAIREGRVMFENIRKVVVYLLANSFSEIILVMGALIFGLPLPILPAQILWINLISDGFPSVALTFEKGEEGVMNEPPRRVNEHVLNKEMLVLIFIVGVVVDLLMFGVFFYMLNLELPIERIRTFLFVKLGLSSLIYVFAIRTLRKSAFLTNPFSNGWLVLAVMVGVLLQIFPIVFVPLRDLFGFVPLTALEWGIVIGLSALNFLLIEVVKMIFHRTPKK